MTRAQFEKKWESFSPLNRDIWVAQAVMDWVVVPDLVNWRGVSIHQAGLCGMDLPEFTEEIASAWVIFTECSRRVFSKRMAFLKELADLLTNPTDLPSGLQVRWPDAIQFLTPELICKAACLSVLVTPLEGDQTTAGPFAK